MGRILQQGMIGTGFPSGYCHTHTLRALGAMQSVCRAVRRDGSSGEGEGGSRVQIRVVDGSAVGEPSPDRTGWLRLCLVGEAGAKVTVVMVLSVPNAPLPSSHGPMAKQAK